ncbi:hypothetical protein JOM56_000337 [Amanita muscaria]
MASDPRIHKPRTPIYTDQQLLFLKSNLQEFERRSQGSIRGDAKKFALEKAAEFVARFGLPDGLAGIEECESRFREQIYNWFKNTVGRARRKSDARPRVGKKITEKDDLEWTCSITAASPTIPYFPMENGAVMDPAQHSLPSLRFSAAQVTMSPPISPISLTHGQNFAQNHSLALVNESTLQDAFMRGMDPTTLTSMIQTFVMAHPSATPLAPVINALYDAIFSDPNAFHQDPTPYLRCYLEAADLFAHDLVHAGTSGPDAGLRALELQIRKNSIWVCDAQHRPTALSPLSNCLADDMKRIAFEYQRRKDHIQWARIHGATLELLALRATRNGDMDGSYATSKLFSEMIVRDAVWGRDEVEWAAGICILRAIIRTTVGGSRDQKDEYCELLRIYENRWKEIKDETRQTIVAEVLLSTKEEFSRWEGILT